MTRYLPPAGGVIELCLAPPWAIRSSDSAGERSEMNSPRKRDPVPPLTCLILFLSTLWANLSAGQILFQIPLTNAANAAKAAAQSSRDIAPGTQAPDFQLRDVDND